MIKNRIVNGQKATDATYVAHADLVRGMGVVKTAGKTAFPAETTDAGIFVVDRDNLPSGVECAYTDRPDKAFDAIKEGEMVLTRAFVVGESFYVDQYAEGAAVVGTGRSDFPNQINNVLAFPGIFRGALDARATCINEEMKIAASYAIAGINEVVNSDFTKFYSESIGVCVHGEKLGCYKEDEY